MQTNLTVKVEDTGDFLIRQTILRALEDGAYRSQSREAMQIDPSTPREKINVFFEGFQRLAIRGGRGQEKIYLQGDGQALVLNLDQKTIDLEVFSQKFDAAAILQGFMTRLKDFALKTQEEDGVWGQFSYWDRELTSTTQFLRCPTWAEVGENYPRQVRASLQALMDLEAPWKHGRLIIWHGPPGTGKTYAIRAMMSEWKSRFGFNIITDPERFAASPKYYFELAQESSEIPSRFRIDPETRAMREVQGMDPDGDGDNEDEARLPKRSLFIMEDTADLILQSSRSSHFDKIGKLLNMTDGLFGQGREDLFMLTFNEEVDRIDPAFLRPGRCITKVEFTPFEEAESAEWLEKRGVSPDGVKGPQTIAQLYARLLAKEGKSPTPVEDWMAGGFGGRKGGEEK